MDKKVSNLAQLSYVRRYTLSGGEQDGLKVIEVNNGRLRVLLNESKALDVMQAWHDGVNLSFVSKNGFVNRETPFLNRFEGGMIYTCGLDSIGAREGYPQHGTFHNIPALITHCSCTEQGVTVVAEIYYTALFGQNLCVRRTFSTDFMSNTFSLTDQLINNGTKEENYCILYHINLGYPMLDQGVKINMDAKSTFAYGDFSQSRLDLKDVFFDAEDNQMECCYGIEQNAPQVTVENQKLGKTFKLEYSMDTLPCFVQWNSNASNDYALGLEPCSSFLGEERFKYSTIKAGQTKQFSIKITVE